MSEKRGGCVELGVDAAVAKSAAYVGNVHDAFAHGLRQRITLRRVAKAVST